jgi:hypothetical protein
VRPGPLCPSADLLHRGPPGDHVEFAVVDVRKLDMITAWAGSRAWHAHDALVAMTTMRSLAPPTGAARARVRAVNSLPILVGAGIAGAYLLAPPMGADLSAQIAWADFAKSHWPALLDLRWYGGINPLGYSVLTPPVMALVGVRLATAVGYLVGVVLVASLLQRTHVRRPVAGGVVAAICLTGNLASSRTTFILGLAVAVAALLALACHRPRLSVLLAILTPLTSPVAGVFLAVAGVALVLSGRRRAGTWLALSALIPTILMGLLFGNGGTMPFAPRHAALIVLASLIVAVACRAVAVVFWGAMLSAVMVAVAYLTPNPLGSNAARLTELLGPPALVAVSVLSAPIVALLTALVLALQPMFYVDEVRDRGDPALDPAFYVSLVQQLEQRGITTPVEVVPMRRHGESAVVAPVAPLARGWLRQVDVGRNVLFYDGSLDSESYRRWLDDNAVSWVALARGEHDWAAGQEAALVRGGLSYLQPVWADQTWTLYQVEAAVPVVSSPGRQIRRDATSLTVDLPAAGEYDLRLRWSRWLSASSGCLEPGPGGWTRVVVGEPATVRVASSLLPERCS